MKITRRQLRRIIRESILQEYGSDPESRNEPGHRDPESGNWVDPGSCGYNPYKDKTLAPDGGWGPEERTAAIRAYLNKDGYIADCQVDKSWKHPQFRARR